MGKYQARIAGDVILGKDIVDVADHGMVPRVTFTDPQVCAVGLTEAQARERAGRPRASTYDRPATWPARTRSATGSTARVSSSIDEAPRRGRRRDVHRARVQELLHSATVAIVGEVPLDRLWHAVPSFPTVSEVWLRLLEAYGL